ncbi:UDP-glucose 4-epimerase GalE [Candidatus Tokpelaia sp.]|uniref:UDP-glucose 4-epimerase GalE n=1 Tax=Candidatus Tokpelaia sp. TaxID=2233777 RepID=UPI001238D6EC|nr:UDP-glucose 4-epimerase GalE [Candidatus Tokpelaia sp.]KAA6404756.1 UDP-glucose 4-epimerase GalE [Candidatus Tokpelaia sp.]
MTILVTGGAGYIGSHICVSLLLQGHSVVIIDNFSNSYAEVIERIAAITGKKPVLAKGDIRDRTFLKSVLETYKCSAVIHLAGLKAVGESAHRPLDYYDCNVYGSLCLLQAMQAANVKKFIFSSTATVYGVPQYLPYDEKHPLAPENVYGRSKLMVETIMADLYAADPGWSFSILRYFNPVGAHESGLIGEDPRGHPNNLMPIIAQVAGGRREKLTIWGNDYPTADGTGRRDYIHVADLAEGHVAALAHLEKAGLNIYNLGCGRPYSVFDVIHTFEHISNRPINYDIGPRRAGDIAEFYANAAAAKDKLGWEAKRDLRSMCADMWNFQVKNPQGYQG